MFKVVYAYCFKSVLANGGLIHRKQCFSDLVLQFSLSVTNSKGLYLTVRGQSVFLYEDTQPLGAKFTITNP